MEPVSARLDRSQIQIWTRTFYTLIQSLALAENINFGRLDDIALYIKKADGWVKPDCSYKSGLLSRPMGRRRVTFRRDPAAHFSEVARQTVKMLVQDLVTILDGQLAQLIAAAGLQPANLPGDKVKALRTYLAEDAAWSYNGCVELVVCRNVMTHAGGRWNSQAIEQLADCVPEKPMDGDVLVIGFSMLFRFRKAIRTFTGELEKTLMPRPAVKSKIRKARRPSAYMRKATLKRLRKARVKERLATDPTRRSLA